MFGLVSLFEKMPTRQVIVKTIGAGGRRDRRYLLHTLCEMVNWCLRNPLEGDPLAADDPRMVALLAYIHHERRGVPLAPGKH
jgi:hypothetical protein